MWEFQNLCTISVKLLNKIHFEGERESEQVLVKSIEIWYSSLKYCNRSISGLQMKR